VIAREGRMGAGFGRQIRRRRDRVNPAQMIGFMESMN
jgi:hypothetical protein